MGAAGAPWLAAAPQAAQASASCSYRSESLSGIDLKWPLEADLRLKKCFSAPQTATPRANMLVEVAAALVEDDRAAETLGAARPGRPDLSDCPGPAARAASPRPSLSSLQGRFVLRVALSCVSAVERCIVRCLLHHRGYNS